MDNIKEIVNGIVDAEREAERLMQDALLDAKSANLNADAEASRIVAEAKAAVKEEKRAVIAAAEQDADAIYAEIVAEGNRKAEALVAEADTAEAEQRIVSAYIAKYVRR